MDECPFHWTRKKMSIPLDKRGMMAEKVERRKALRALFELDHAAFGNDKGSGEAYTDFCETMELCDPWDGESEITDNNHPPGFVELLIAAGIDPQEIFDATGINDLCFPAEMLAAYGHPPIKVR